MNRLTNVQRLYHISAKVVLENKRSIMCTDLSIEILVALKLQVAFSWIALAFINFNMFCSSVPIHQ